ncbi:MULTISPECIES: hypothetical protein [Pseudomonas]|nr:MULTISPECIES: hypothetical protein [Pseudomonas]MDE3738697.1 hypothetical protein [Pseudomonas resinovorans]
MRILKHLLLPALLILSLLGFDRARPVDDRHPTGGRVERILWMDE